MNYRDDRDALRNQVESLQQELGVARADQERFQHLEQRLEAAKREMHALESELGHARRKPKSNAASILIAVMLIFGVFAGAAMFALTRRRAQPIPVVVAQPPIQPVPTAVDVPPIQTVPTPIPPQAPPTDPAPPRVAHLQWAATVTKSNHPSVHAGATCKVNADAIPDSNGMHVTGVVVTCGQEVIYDEAGHLNGMSMLDSDAKQHAGPKAGTWVYDLIFSDAGSRSTTRNQAKLDSTLRIGRIWSENLPQFGVDLSIRSGSAPVGVAVVDL